MFLYVKPTGSRSQVLRYQVQGRRRNLGLGAFPDVSLAMARDRVAEARRFIANGEDPIAKKQQAKPKTFQEAALELIESKRPGWKNAKHAAQWASTLESYVFPKIGQVEVTKIETADVIGALTPIWIDRPETASAFVSGSKQSLTTPPPWASAVATIRPDGAGNLHLHPPVAKLVDEETLKGFGGRHVRPKTGTRDAN